MRFCEQISEEQEERLAKIAELILADNGNWMEYSDAPGAISNDLLAAYTSADNDRIDEASRLQMRRCLFRQLARADARITPEDEERLRLLARKLDHTHWPSNSDYFQKLVTAVREGYSDRPLSLFRAQCLAAELSCFIVGLKR